SLPNQPISSSLSSSDSCPRERIPCCRKIGVILAAFRSLQEGCVPVRSRSGGHYARVLCLFLSVSIGFSTLPRCAVATSAPADPQIDAPSEQELDRLNQEGVQAFQKGDYTAAEK